MSQTDQDTLLKQARRRPVYDAKAEDRVVLDRQAIERMLPHRDPMLLVDGIDAVDLELGAVSGARTIDPKDPVLAGHFPGDPVYPGVLLLEMIGQLGICLMHLMHHGRASVPESDSPRAVRLLKVRMASFQGAVLPGAKLELVARAIENTDYVSTCLGQVLEGGEVKAFALYEVYLPDES